MAYIACDDMDFMWEQRDLEVFRQMWKEGFCVTDIARAFGRDVDEIGILVMDQKRKREIKDRPGGAWGRRMPDERAKGGRHLSTGRKSRKGKERTGERADNPGKKVRAGASEPTQATEG
ncbi:hypothetical protein PDENDC454_04229 [Paenibacillus dendritiformis C454]|uniref:Helix-turn-helix domain containing protein n=1 Tax=Paenibacillus dendritiformis C454 TaxID=1131935 RepID=H3SBG0_9BACL|nr:hypothetical protein [Paenibacillus dendritiformis]EHQ63643.1 hypothetical protein PDENDC454_04229 [Paenibacillus dendritiformis C454]